MSPATTARKIDDLLSKAEKSLRRKRYFEAERMAGEALLMARQKRDYQRMATIIRPLQKARQGRLALAVEIGRVTILNAPFTEGDEIEPGSYLIRPPMVGVDARRFRLAAFALEVPVAVVCHEPITRLGLCPLVALSGNVVVRTKIDPPADPDRPDLPWVLDAMQVLGDWAIESMDTQLAPERYIDELLSRIDAIPEHDGLHECLEEACRHEAEAAAAAPPAGGGRKRKAKP
ncbi:MAG: hypothetical protein V3T84_09160 [Phycisphaerales bacterium]